MNLVDVGLFGREGDVFADLIADVAQELVIDQALNYCMLVSDRYRQCGRSSCCQRDAYGCDAA